MEARQITIVSSRTQQKTIIESAATTLGELKADLDHARIDYAGLSFFEGISKTELNDDDAILPHDLPWKGEITNNLVFMLTEPQKKIKNGVTTRAEAYDYIRKHNLGAEVEKKYGNNFTRCKTVDLIAFVDAASKPAPKAKPVKSAPKKSPKVATKKAAPTKKAAAADHLKVKHADPKTIISHEALVGLLVRKGVISQNEAVGAKSTNTQFSDAEISDMFRIVK